MNRFYQYQRFNLALPAALIEALQDGGISHKEQSLLARLRDSLGISESDAEAIENELQAQTSS
jgi:uncharacterized tellurite resistance protein B-like protein